MSCKSCSCCACEEEAFKEKLKRAYGEPDIDDICDGEEFFDIELTIQDTDRMQTMRKLQRPEV